MPGYQVFSFMILTVGHLATDRVAVHMHIQRTHKNRNLYTAIGKIFISLYFFYYYHFTIRRGHNGIFIYGMHSFRYTEKRDQENKQAKGYYSNNCGYYRVIKT